MTLLTALLGAELAGLFWEHADQMETDIQGYVRPYLHPEDAVSLEDAVAAKDLATCASIVLRYGIRYEVNRMPHLWYVDNPYRRTQAKKPA
jgi:hypothetical protein